MLVGDLKNYIFDEVVLYRENPEVDGEYIDSLRDVKMHWAGSSNQRIIDVQQTLKQNKVILYEG